MTTLEMQDKKTVQFNIDSDELLDIKKDAITNDVEYFEYEGVLQDNYIFYDAERINFDNNSRKYIIVAVEFLNTWSSGLVLIMTDSDEEAEKYRKAFES